jgi:hypothetical protein
VEDAGGPKVLGDIINQVHLIHEKLHSNNEVIIKRNFGSGKTRSILFVTVNDLPPALFLCSTYEGVEELVGHFRIEYPKYFVFGK